MKIFKALLFSFIVLISFAGCSEKNDEVEIKNTLTNFISSYQNKDFDALNDYIESEDNIISQLYIKDNKENNLIMDTITKNLTYTIDNVEINGNEATVKLTSSNVNMMEIMPVVIGTYLEKGSEDDENLLYNLLEENLLNEDAEKTELSFSVPVIKKGGKWLISKDADTQFYDGLTGQYFSYVLLTTESLSMMSNVN